MLLTDCLWGVLVVAGPEKLLDYFSTVGGDEVGTAVS